MGDQHEQYIKIGELEGVSVYLDKEGKKVKKESKSTAVRREK